MPLPPKPGTDARKNKSGKGDANNKNAIPQMGQQLQSTQKSGSSSKSTLLAKLEPKKNAAKRGKPRAGYRNIEERMPLPRPGSNRKVDPQLQYAIFRFLVSEGDCVGDAGKTDMVTADYCHYRCLATWNNCIPNPELHVNLTTEEFMEEIFGNHQYYELNLNSTRWGTAHPHQLFL